MVSNTIYIPVQDSSSYVRLPSNGFHSSAFPSIKELLFRELSPLSLWYKIALQYYKNGQLQLFQQLLLEAHNISSTQRFLAAEQQRYTAAADAAPHSASSEYAYRIYILIALAAYHGTRAVQSSESIHLLSVELSHSETFLRKAEECLLERVPTKSGNKDLTEEQDRSELHFHVWDCRGFFYLLQSLSTDDASRQVDLQGAASALFSRILQFDEKNVLAHIGMGECYFLSGQYALALRNYCQALLWASTLDLSPHLAVSLRYSIAICFMHTQDSQKAIAMLRRCLEIDANHVPTLLALAAILNSINTESDVKAALENIERAYLLDPTDPHVRAFLANHVFFTRDFEATERLLNETKFYSHALQRYSLNMVTAEAHYQFGRLLHVRKAYVEAYARYRQAYDIRPNHTATLFNLAKCAIYLNRLLEAKQYLNGILMLYPLHSEVLKLLAFTELLCAIKPKAVVDAKPAASLVASQAVIPTQPDSASVEPLVQVGHMIRRIGVSTAGDTAILAIQIRTYEALISKGKYELISPCVALYVELFKHLRHLKRKEEDTMHLEENELLKWTKPFELLIEHYNNYGVLLLLGSKLYESQQLLDYATKKLTDILANADNLRLKERIRYRSLMVTVKFNTAVLSEHRSDYSLASNLYKELNNEFPEYVDAWIKRILFAMERSDFKLAENYCRLAMKSNPAVGDLYVLLASIYHQRHRSQISVEILEKGMKDASNGLKNDSYACTYLAALQFELSKQNPERSSRLVFDAFHNFKISLKKPHKANVYAANGLAAILAEHSMTLPAWDCLRLLMDTSSGFFRYIINRNMGLLLGAITLTDNPDIKPGNLVLKMDAQKFSKAYTHYLIALECRPMEKEIYLLFGRFLYDCMKFQEAIELLQVAQIKWPNDIIVSFNLIVCMDALIVRELRPGVKIEDPAVMCELLHMSEFVATSLEGLIRLRKMWMSQKASKPLVAADKGSLSQYTLTRNEEGHPYIYTSPCGIGKLPEVTMLEGILLRYKTIYIPNAQSDLPEIEINWIKAYERKEQIKLEQQQLRQQKEEMELQREKSRLLAEKWQQDRAALLMSEANRTAALIHARREGHLQDKAKAAAADSLVNLDTISSETEEIDEAESKRLFSAKLSKKERKEERKRRKELRKERRRLKRMRKEESSKDVSEDTEAFVESPPIVQIGTNSPALQASADELLSEDGRRMAVGVELSAKDPLETEIAVDFESHSTGKSVLATDNRESHA